MTEQEIQKKLQVIITSTLGEHLAPAESVKPESDLVHDFGADSLDFLQILYEAKEKFGISISGAEEDLIMESFREKPTVQNLINTVSEKLNNNTLVSENFVKQPVEQPVKKENVVAPVVQEKKTEVLKKVSDDSKKQPVEQSAKKETIVAPVVQEKPVEQSAKEEQQIVPNENILSRLFKNIKSRYANMINKQRTK